MKYEPASARVIQTLVTVPGRIYVTILLFLLSSLCARVTSENSTTKDTIVTKDINLIGLFPFEGGWHAGHSILAGYELAMEHINKRKDILPGYKLKLFYNDTKCDDGQGANILYHYLYTPPTKVMVLGGACSSVSEITGIVTPRWNLVQISSVSLSPTLNDKSKFPRFFRIISSASNYSNEARIDLIKYFKWKCVSTIHSVIPIFNEQVDALSKMFAESNIKVVTTQAITDHNVSSQVQQLKVKRAKIIIGHFNEDVARNVLCEAYKLNLYGREIVWILNGWYSRTWISDRHPECTPEQIKTVINRQIFLTRIWSYFAKMPSISGYKPQEIVELHRQRLQDKDRHNSLQGPMAYDSMWAAALAINKTIQDLVKSGGKLKIEDFNYKNSTIGELLFRNVQKTDFYGASGIVDFKNKERTQTHYEIAIFIDGKSKKLGEYNPSLQKDIKIEWDFDNVAAQIWEDGKVPKDMDVNIKSLSLKFYIIMCSFSILGIILSMFLIIFSIVFRNKRAIRITSPRLNIMTLIGCMMLYSVIFFVHTEEYTNVTICQAKITLLTLGFSMTLGSLFAKEWRIYKIFLTDIKQREIIHDGQLIRLTLYIVFTNLFVIITWFTTDHLRIVNYELHDGKKNDIATIQKCESPNQHVFIIVLYGLQLILLFFGAFLAIQTRNVQMKRYSNSKIIGICIYNIILLFILEMTTTISLSQKDVDVTYGVGSGIIIFGTTFIQCLLVGTTVKTYVLHHDDNEWMDTFTTQSDTIPQEPPKMDS